MRPWWPLRSNNELLELVSLGTLHLICVGLAVAGAAGVWIRYQAAHGR
jgi:hypothetical protein